MPTFFQKWAARIAAALGGPAQNSPELSPVLRETGDAENRGSGTIARGGAVAAGAGGASVGGNVYGGIHITGTPPAGQNSRSELRAAYLGRVREQCGYLSLAGIDPVAAGQGDAESRLRLDAVYTALLTRTPRERVEGQDSEIQQRRLKRDEPPLSALEQLDRHPKLVLQGDPGSGKSSFVNFVALCLAGEALGDHQVNLRYLTAPTLDGDPVGYHTPQPWSYGALLPVPVVLRDFAATGLPRDRAATAHHLWAFIEDTLKAAALTDYITPLHRELCERGGLLLLDGLDEVPEAERRREQVKQAVEDFVRSFGKCRVLVTSRTYAYQNQGWRLQGFAEAMLAPFSKGQIRRFVTNWYRHAAGAGRLKQEDAAGRAELLKQAIFNRLALYELAERPLLLTLMASLHAWRGGGLPEKREALYAETVDLLLNRWEQRLIQREADGRYQLLQPSLAEYLKVDQTKVRGVLEALAFEAHCAQPELTGTADIAEDALAGNLLRLSSDPTVKGNPALLMEYLQNRAGVLYPRGVGVHTFPHRSFQEYLAACYLTDDDYPDKIAQFARVDPDRWREVALLAGAKAAKGAAFALWSLVDALCDSEPDATTASRDAVWGAQIAAQAIIEIADLSRLNFSNQRKLARVRQWLMKLLRDERLPVTERALAGDNLATLGDPRFDAEQWYLPAEPLFGFREIPAGLFLMGSDSRRDKRADDRECPQHEVNLPGYYLSRWPVTVAQFAAFVKESGFQPEDPDCLKGIANHPVIRVSVNDALAYCRWLDTRLKGLARERLVADNALSANGYQLWPMLANGSLGIGLPSEAEWEKGARGTDGRLYPWGDDPDPNRANYGKTGLNGTSAVGCFPNGASPYDCEEMSGNVWEWTRSQDDKYPYILEKLYQQTQKSSLAAANWSVRRGGAFIDGIELVRCAFRNTRERESDDVYAGFRVVASPFFSER